ncbi:hypothetical protein ON010_g5294 [Phytophthora cinnamomi]|nr:hypothetical protein ON010_g5294 [Phytophthora cinnamomi]
MRVGAGAREAAGAADVGASHSHCDGRGGGGREPRRESHGRAVGRAQDALTQVRLLEWTRVDLDGCIGANLLRYELLLLVVMQIDSSQDKMKTLEKALLDPTFAKFMYQALDEVVPANCYGYLVRIAPPPRMRGIDSMHAFVSKLKWSNPGSTLEAETETADPMLTRTSKTLLQTPGARRGFHSIVSLAGAHGAGAVPAGRARVRHLLAPAQGAHRVRARARERRHGVARDGAAAVPRVGEPGERTLHPAQGQHAVHGPGRLHGLSAARRRRPGLSVGAAQLPRECLECGCNAARLFVGGADLSVVVAADHDSPAVGRSAGHGERHRHPGRGDHQAPSEAAACCRLNGLYASHTGKPLKVIEQAMDRDLFMDPREAQEFGIIDSIIANRKPTTPSGEQ